MPQKRSKTSKKTAKRGGNRPPKGSPPPKNPSGDADDRMSLRRFLAASGLDSRRNIDEYLSDERVSVDGKVITEPSTMVDPTTQRICVDGERKKLEPKRYFLLNKPKGFLCTNQDPKGRRRAVDLVTVPNLRLFTVGRLDENSEGLILVTNDGDLANKLAHPRYQVRRKYQVHVAGIPKQSTLAELKDGLHFRDGRFRLHGAKRLKTQGKSSFLEIEMREGQNREIRRLMARVGHKVMQLQRVEFGPLRLGHLGSGKFRPLNVQEVKALREFVAEMEEVRRKPSSKRRAATRTAPKKSPAARSETPSARSKRAPKRSPVAEKKSPVTRKKGATTKKKTITTKKTTTTKKTAVTKSGPSKRKVGKKKSRKRS